MSSRDKNSASIDDHDGSNVTPRPELKTGAGAEAAEGMDGKPETDSTTPRSAYGGENGKPKLPKDS